MATFLQPRLDESENRGPIILIVNGTVTGIAVIVVGLRAISRILILKQFGMDDWTMMIATIFAVLNVVVAGLGVKYGTGKHKWNVNSSDTLPSAKIRYVTHIVYTLISGLIKLSICLLYLRLFPNIRKITVATIWFITAMSTAVIIATIFQCSPVGAVFDTTKYEHYKCFASIPFWYSTAVLSLVTDIWILVLPLRTILGLQLAPRKRYMVIALLSLGLFACIASIVRMVYIVKLYASSDPTWDTFGVSIWSGIELAVAIIAASIPAIRPGTIPLLFCFGSRGGMTQSSSQRIYHSDPLEASSRRYQRKDAYPLSFVTLREGSEEDDDESTKAIAHAS